MNTKSTAVAILLALVVGHAQAQSSSTAQQSSNSQSVAQGSIAFSTNPEHTTQTVRNVGAIANGSAAFSASQLNCGQTSQGGIAIAGLSVIGGTSTSPLDCRLEVAASELARQSTIDAAHRDQLLNAAINVRCQLGEEVYNAMMDAGIDCKRKPASLVSRTDDQPPSTRIASGN